MNRLLATAALTLLAASVSLSPASASSNGAASIDVTSGPAIAQPVSVGCRYCTMNGTSLNGLHSNGMRTNGMKSNGMRSNGMHINGMRINGLHVNGLHINGMHVNGLRQNGNKLNGTADRSAQFVVHSVTLPNGNRVTFR